LGSPKSPIGNQVKQLLIIYLSHFIYPQKNLLFVFFLLLILSFTGCKSVVKEPVVKEPVVKEPVVEELDITQKTVSLEVWYFGIRNGLNDWYDEKQEGVKSEDNKDVSKYSGEFKHGQGAFTWSDGTKYVGSWKDGMMNGQGTMTFGRGKHEGDKYIGEWKDGRQNGQGISFSLMEKSILGVGRMERNLVKEDSITLMEESMSVKISMG